MGNRDYQLWDEHDGFFYDVLRYPDGRFRKFRVRSLVGLIPLFAVERLEVDWIEPFKEFRANLRLVPAQPRQHWSSDVVHTVEAANGEMTHVLTIVDQDQLQRLLDRVCDPTSSCRDYGIRSLSKAHERSPFELRRPGGRLRAGRGRSQAQGRQLELARADLVPDVVPADRIAAQARQGVRAELPAADAGDAGREPSRFPTMAQDLADRMIRIFTRDARRPAAGLRRRAEVPGRPALARSVLFYEYFHGDNGAGLGASHQTGWTALVASLIDEWRR